jgi:serine/threonine protein phosphatase PrpC
MQEYILHSYGISDPGKQRENNEDFFLIDNNQQLYMVADGMGGHNAGELASQTACRTFSELFTPTADGIKAQLVSCLQKTNALIYEKSNEDISLHGMGTTLVICYCHDGQVHICHAGDSRAYLFRDKKLVQLTEDHSAVALMVKQGYITKEEAMDHPLKNRITKAVGTMPDVEPDYMSLPIQEDDILLLCSDGLSNMVRDQEMETILSSREHVKGKTKMLVQLANERGGLDNITVVLVEIVT